MAKSFYYKLVILFFIICSFSFFAITIAILPSYFLSSVKNNILDEKLQAQKSESVPLPDQNVILTIKNLNKEIDIVENAENSKFVVSEKVINAIILKKMLKIKITDISYDEGSQSSPAQDKKIIIKGIAPSREVLLLFRQALQSDVTFKQVDLPISNFVKGSNIGFSLSLIPA